MKLFFTAHRDLHSKPQLSIMKRSTDSGKPSPSGYIYITVLACMSQGTWEKWVPKDYKSQNTKKSEMK